jgi:hypothetical protein
MLERGRYAEARVLLERALPDLAERGQRGAMGAWHACLLPALAHARDWAAWDACIERVRALHAESRFLDPDMPRMEDLAGRLAKDAGEPARARDAWALACEHWRAIGRPEDALPVEAALAGLPAHP